MATPEQHIKDIRKTKFSIGAELNPLTEDLHQAVKNLSAELYAKDVHFLMELIQNAEDNEYPEGVDPSLEFVITSKDITQTGATATLLIFNNEKGFSAKNIESICSVGRSTKKGNRKRGYIGEKGIGFKSVFLITAQPYIFSNGYKIRFNEEPDPHCNLGYIVPEWVEENPNISEINQVYGAGAALPTTTIVLPLKPDKVKPVKQQLSSIHPEVLLFLSKIKRLSVKEDNEDPRLNTVSAISISSETNFVTRKNIDAESYTLHLAAEEKSSRDSEKECSYYMWKQKFPVRKENIVDRRMEVEELVVTLAFPYGQRLHRGMSLPGIYAFLPTEMVTNLPFIIQGDFLLASSRETILLDNKWNKGILECVPTAFVTAFVSMVKTTEGPVSGLTHMFRFLPVIKSSYPELNVVSESIRTKLVQENIVPCQSYMEQKFFGKPREVGRLKPAFWIILNKAREQGVSLHNLSSHGKYILSFSFDRKDYDQMLDFLGVDYVDIGWYAKCIQSSNIVLGLSEEAYLELLLFLAENWSSCFHDSNMKNVPLLKYMGFDDSVSLHSISESRQQYGKRTVLMSQDSSHMSWLADWNREFKCLGNRFFMPKSMQEAIKFCSKKESLLKWLKDEVKVSVVSVYGYAVLLNDSINDDRKLVIAFVHFLFHSLTDGYMSGGEVQNLCGKVSLLDNYGHVTTCRNGVLVPANGSKWVELIGCNPWREGGYVELGEEYLHSGCFAGLVTPKNGLLKFLKTYVGASDIPGLSPPNDGISTMATPLTKRNAFLLLDWIRNLTFKRIHMPERFLKSIKEGSWLKTSLSGSTTYRPPSQSFWLDSSCGNLLQNGSAFVDIPLIDRGFYGDVINDYKQELKTIGVMFEYGEACEFIGKHLMSLAASSILTKGNVISILDFIRFLREKAFSPNKFIDSIREGKWMKTSLGYRTPVGSVLYSSEWKSASQISDIPFVDIDYYGNHMLSFNVELALLGVVVGFNKNYQLVADCFKYSSCLTSLTAEAVILILKCMRHSNSSEKLVKALKDVKFLKTTIGYKSPGETFWSEPEWGSLLQVFNCFPLIDRKFFGSSFPEYVDELRRLGVKADFEEAAKAFACAFKSKASSLGKENVLLFLACYRQLRSTSLRLPSEFKKSIREVKWLRTRLGDYRLPNECILFGPDWESIDQITLLPFIDDSDNCYGKGIHEYKKELKSMGVITEFKEGVKFVIAGLYLPHDPCEITPASVLSLLECIRIMQQEQKDSLPESFIKKVSKRWIKTHAGYKYPKESLLFDSKWASFFFQTDGPFIDTKFYGTSIMKYGKELNAIGVIVDVAEGGELLSSCLLVHSDFLTIVRIYSYLNEVQWKPSNESARLIGIPDGSDIGKWVSPNECVLYDKDGLFGSQLNVLDEHYEQILLHFFVRAFKVRSNPSVADYCKLWNIWESSGSPLSQEECCAFWGYVTKHWSSKTEKTLVDSLEKLPVNSGLDGILLFDKRDVFIADDLLLKDLFEQSSSRPIFVWYPQPCLPALPRTELLETYRKIGVCNLSESVEKEEVSMVSVSELKQVNPKEIPIYKELVRLILAFLAGPSVKMEAENRREAVECLVNLTILKTVEPIAVSYSLPLSSGEVLNVTASRMIRWDRENSKLFMQKMDKSAGHRNTIEYATYFAEVLSEGVLWEKEEDLICELAELIKLAFLVKFDVEAVGFLMKNKNLQTFTEDEEFLLSAYPSG